MKFLPGLEETWQKTFNNLADSNIKNYQASHWTKDGFEIRFKHLSPLLKEMCKSVKGLILDLGAGAGEYSVCGNS